MTRIGTSHFKTAGDAYRYYRKQDSAFTMGDAMHKIKAGEISIGPPEIPTGTELGCDDDGRYFIDEITAWEKRKLRRARERTQEQRIMSNEAQRLREPTPATRAQLVNRSIKAAGGYPAPKGFKVVGYDFTQPKQTASLTILRTHWRIRVQVSRAGAHHMTGRVYTRLIARGRSFNEALEYAVERVKVLREKRRVAEWSGPSIG